MTRCFRSEDSLKTMWEDLSPSSLKKRHDLAQLYLDMVECVLRKYKKKKGLLETEEELTDLYKPQLNRFGLVALNGLLNDKLDLNESELGNHAKDLTEFGFLA